MRIHPVAVPENATGDNALADLAALYLDQLRRSPHKQVFLFANRGSDPFMAESAFATLAPDKCTILLTMARRVLRSQYEFVNQDTTLLAADYYRAIYEANGHRLNLIGEAQYRLPQTKSIPHWRSAGRLPGQARSRQPTKDWLS